MHVNCRPLSCTMGLVSANVTGICKQCREEPETSIRDSRSETSMKEAKLLNYSDRAAGVFHYFFSVSVRMFVPWWGSFPVERKRVKWSTFGGWDSNFKIKIWFLLVVSWSWVGRDNFFPQWQQGKGNLFHFSFSFPAEMSFFHNIACLYMSKHVTHIFSYEQNI